MRAFVAIRQLLLNPPADRFTTLQTELAQLKEYIEEVFTDYNDINEETKQQLEIINKTLAEFAEQQCLPYKPRGRIGYFTKEQIENREDIIE